VGHSATARAQLARLQVGVLAPPSAASSSGPLIVILDKSDAGVEAAALSRALPGARVQALDLRSQEAAMAHPALPDADAVMMWHTLTLDAPLIARLPRARVIVRVGVGFDNIDLRACAAAGLPVCNVPNYGTEEVADHAMSLLLNLTRRTGWSEARARAGEAAHGSDGVALIAAGTRRLRGLTLGLIGCGRIGTAMAVRAKAFGLDVVRWGAPRPARLRCSARAFPARSPTFSRAPNKPPLPAKQVFFDPHAPAGTDKALGIRRAASAEALAAQSHIISLHADLNPTSRGIVSEKLLRLLPPGAFVINTARGGMIDEAALRRALEEGRVAGAGIDVHEKEPFVGTDKSQPLAGAPNCINTPHSAFYSEEGFREMRELAAQSAIDALQGRPLQNVVNARLLAGAAPRSAIIEPRD